MARGMDPMRFEGVRDALEALLNTYKSTDFRVIGEQTQAQGAEEVEDDLRSVEVYYSEGDFPKAAGSMPGPLTHEMTFKVDLTASAAAEGDVATLEAPGSTSGERAIALAGIKRARRQADRSLDVLWRHVCQILQAADSVNLEVDTDTWRLSSRWLGNYRKDEPISYGELVVITGSATFTCKIEEDTTGVIPVETASTEYDLNLEVTHDEEGVMDEEGLAGVANVPPA